MPGTTRGLSVAILGTRGIPARYGGFETFAEQLARRLAGRGHRVRVYCRSRYAGDLDLPGVDTPVLPAIYTKYLETVSHGLLSALHCGAHRPDAALICTTVNACFLPVFLQAGVPAALCVDGIEWQRRKWNRLGRAAHWLAEHLAAAWADVLVADARFIGQHYRAVHGVSPVFIPYGGDLDPPAPGDAGVLEELDLEPGAYDLSVCRFEPENNPLTVVRAHGRLGGDRPLVMVGGAPYSRRYQQQIRDAATPGVRFAGYRYGDEYRQLLFRARAVIYAGEVGGTHPALLEAMGAGRAVVYNDTPENREAVGEAGLPFGPGSEEHLVEVWGRLDREPGLLERCAERARRRVRLHYRWDMVTEAYEDLFNRMRDNGGG
jgi:glycosyltransferase involved in cell wall biosynthesis